MSRECHGCVMLLQTATDMVFLLGFLFPLTTSHILVMQNKHKGAFFWCLYKFKHMQLFQTMLWNGGVGRGGAANLIPTVGTGEKSRTEQGILTCATWPRSVAIHSHLFALIAVRSLHPQKAICNLEPLPGDKISGRITSPAGRGDKQCHPHFVLSSPTDFRS